jgi:hypothetical protein
LSGAFNMQCYEKAVAQPTFACLANVG